MQTIQPKPPKNLHPLSCELLDTLAGHEETAEIVLGGGVALSHYLEYRETVDIDAWWRTDVRPEVLDFVGECMRTLAAKHGFGYRRRTWGETESLEFLKDGQKQFSFQISKRGIYLDEALPTKWRPLWIETLRDNVASKMTALVQRGAPRDFLDIYELCQRGIILVENCWQLWQAKHPGIPSDEARRKIIARLAMIETTRPLERIQPPAARERAAFVRAWFRDTFACPSTT